MLWYVFAVQGCCAVAAFYFSRVACMTMAQIYSSTLPTVLITPVLSAVSAALWVCKLTPGSSKGLLEFVGKLNFVNRKRISVCGYQHVVIFLFFMFCKREL